MASAGDCDCNGNQLDALGVCEGESDIDGDGICTDEIPGCTDNAACNYNPDTDEDGSCLTNDALGVCGGDCPADLDGDSLCDDVDVSAPTTTTASATDLAPSTTGMRQHPRRRLRL